MKTSIRTVGRGLPDFLNTNLQRIPLSLNDWYISTDPKTVSYTRIYTRVGDMYTCQKKAAIAKIPKPNFRKKISNNKSTAFQIVTEVNLCRHQLP